MRGRELPALLAVVVAGAVPAAAMALSLSQFTIMPDELGYVKQATELGRAELVVPGDFWFNSWSLLGPLMLAPGYHWLSSTAAFDFGHVLSAVAMASTAIPVFLVARRTLPSSLLAYLVALLSVAVPWLAMAGTLMTEVVAYPAFAWAFLATVHAAARPGWRADALLLAALVVAFLARTHLAVLAPGALAVIALHALTYRADERGARARLLAAARDHRLLLAAFALALLAVAIGGSTRFVGAYSTATQGSTFQTQTLAFARDSLAYVVIAIGVVPAVVAAAWALVQTLGGRAARDVHALAVATLVVGGEIVLVGGAFTARFANGINDRYVFYVAPVMFLAMAVGLSRPFPRRALALAVSGGAVAWLTASARMDQEGPTLISPSAVWHTVLSDVAGAIADGFTTAGLMAVVTLLAAAALIVLARRVAPAALAIGTSLVLLAFCAAETGYTYTKIAATQKGTSAEFREQRGWIDRALPAGSRAAVILTTLGERGVSVVDWWDTIFWNKTVTGVHFLPGSDGYETGFARELAIDERTGRIPALDPYTHFVRGGLDTRMSLRGSTTVAVRGGYLVLRATRPYRAEWALVAGDPEESVVAAGSRSLLHAWRDPGTSGAKPLGVTLRAPEDAAGAVPVVVRASGRETRATLAPGEQRTLELEADYDTGGRATVAIEVPEASPSHARLLAIAQP